MRSLIKSLAGKHTVILSTHILPEVTLTCQKVLILNQGRLVAHDDIQKLTGPRGEAAHVSLEETFIKLTHAA